MGPIWSMSSPLPCGTPSTTSTRTTSPSSFKARFTAQLAPTLPPPTTVIFLRIRRHCNIQEAMNLCLEAVQAARFARLALDCVTREYPNKIAHVLHSDADARPPRLLTPAFYGCYDWHSAVHGHWLLARVARLFPNEPFAAEARAALARNITPVNIDAEVLHMRGEDRAAFERPYGLAWLLTLAAELRLGDPRLAESLAPLEALASEHLA